MTLPIGNVAGHQAVIATTTSSNDRSADALYTIALAPGGRAAILDRVVHSSHKIELKSTKSLRDIDAAAN